MTQVDENTISQLTNSSEIVKHLFLAELRRIDAMLEKLVKRNDQLQGLGETVGFMYQGRFYKIAAGKRPPMYGERAIMHDELIPGMMKYLQASARLVTECTLVNQMVFRLTQGCTSRQDIRDALPECIVVQDKLLDLNQYTRTRPAAFTLEGDERAMRQYKKVEPLFMYYAGTHLLL